MRRILLFGICLIMLTACLHDKEAKKLKKSEAVQTEINEAIEEQAIDDYGIKVDVNIEKLSFSYPEGKMLLPLKTDKRLEVPVETIGGTFLPI